MIIFDLDGVLVDACEWHRVALNNALKEVCDYEISLEDHYSKFNGIPTRVKMNILTKDNIINECDHERIYFLKQKNTVTMIEEMAQMRQEKIDLMVWLRRQGYVVACFTNSIRETATIMLEKTGILDYFDLVVANQDVTVPKPSPEGYEKVMSHFKIDKNSVMIVEDSPKGIESATASGCKVMRVKNPDYVTINNIKEFIDENFNTDGG